MAPVSWATVEQTTYLEARIPAYEAVRPTKIFGGFWASLFEDWFKTYPEHSVLFPTKAESDLTEEDKSEIGKAIEVQRQVSMSLL